MLTTLAPSLPSCSHRSSLLVGLLVIAASACDMRGEIDPASPPPAVGADADECEGDGNACGALDTATKATTYVRGNLSFQPDYRITAGTSIAADLGQIPGTNNSYAKMRHLFVCAYERDGTADFGTVTSSPFSGNDDLLGCAAANRDGYYNIAITGLSSSWGDDVYLLTWFCDQADFSLTTAGGVTYPDSAEVCVRLNVDSEPSSSDSATGRHRKFLRTQAYSNNLVWNAVNYINWNLSCPNKSGLSSAAQYIACGLTAAEPTTNENCQSQSSIACLGDRNSNWFWNKEAAHLFRALVEPVKTFGSLKPRSSKMAPGVSPCLSWACQDEIQATIRHDTVPLAAGQSRECDLSTNNHSSGFQRICITHGTNGKNGTLNPFRPVHEIGHNIMRRWMNDSSNLQQGCGGTGWASGGAETVGTSEGFANFFSTASWYNHDMSNPTYDGNNMESSVDSALSGSCGSGTSCGCSEGGVRGEGRPSQFFWDLYDVGDSMDINMWDIMRVWSNFPNGDGDAESDECGPDGRNIEDFVAHYETLRGLYFYLSPYSTWPSASSNMSLNCVDRHRNGTTTCHDNC